jgi:hypothetical protein
MRFEVVRTLPVSRVKGFEYMRDMATWPAWTPLTVDVEDGTFLFSPVRTVRFMGRVTMEEEVAHEAMTFVFTSPVFPPVEMRWSFRNSGPGAFTLRVVVSTAPKDAWHQIVEGLTLMMPTLKRALMRSLDKLELVFLGELPMAPADKEMVSV